MTSQHLASRSGRLRTSLIWVDKVSIETALSSKRREIEMRGYRALVSSVCVPIGVLHHFVERIKQFSRNSLLTESIDDGEVLRDG